MEIYIKKDKIFIKKRPVFRPFLAVLRQFKLKITSYSIIHLYYYNYILQFCITYIQNQQPSNNPNNVLYYKLSLKKQT